MKTTTAILAVAIGAAPAVLAGCPDSCGAPGDNPVSCSNTTAENTCCFEAPGGLLQQTQFWDTDPSAGPADTWTIHGLWPNNCDGSYQTYCDETRQYTNITEILQSYGETNLLNYMQTYWATDDGNEESFWEHEWGKHGTCMSTLYPECYTNYSPQEEVVDFFLRVVNLYQQLDTYTFLANEGITPSADANYTLSAVQQALSDANNGNGVYVGCDNTGALEQVYYYYYVDGSIQLGNFEQTDASPYGNSNCPDSVVYLPKQLDTAEPTSTVASAQATATLDTSSNCRPNGI